MVQTVGQAWQRASWIHRLFVAILGTNIVLILAGALVVPATLATPTGVAILLSDVGLQVALAVLSFVGPWSFTLLRRSIGIGLVLGFVFAVVYNGILLRELLGYSDDFNIVGIFVVIALVAGIAAGYYTHDFRQGLLVAIWSLVIGTAIWGIGLMVMNYATWGSHNWYNFWKNDGAIDDFHRSGSTDLNVFLLQDMQGALFFHPLLSVFLGALSGVAGTAIGQGLVWGQHLLLRQSHNSPTR